MGRAFAEQLATVGARMLLADVDAEGLEETLQLVGKLGAGPSQGVTCDVRRLAEWEKLRERGLQMGDVSLLINNAGVAVSGQLLDVPQEDLEWVMDVNVWGVLQGCRTFGPQMSKRRAGYIINIASAAGLLSPPNLGPYNISKAAVISLSETLHAELKDRGVRVSVVCPTFFQTNIMAAARGGSEKQAKLIARMMQRSRVQAPEVARHALDAVAAGRLYCVPMLDGKGFWALKRLLPQGYSMLAARIAKAQREKL